jgi:hypothetical protein
VFLTGYWFLVGGFADVEKFYQQCDPGELAAASDSPSPGIEFAWFFFT